MANTGRYSIGKRQIPSCAAGFGSKTEAAPVSPFCYCQEGLVADQSHLVWVLLGMAVIVFTALKVKRGALQFHQEGCGSNWLLECGICPVFTGCPEHPPSSQSSAAQLQKDTGKILETSVQLTFYLEVCLLILKKQLLVEGEIALIHHAFSTPFAWFLSNYLKVITYSEMWPKAQVRICRDGKMVQGLWRFFLSRDNRIPICCYLGCQLLVFPES